MTDPDQLTEYSRLEQSLRNARSHLDATMMLVEITRDLAGLTDLDRVLETVTRRVCEALHCERASLFLHDEQAGELFTRVTTQLEIREIRTSMETGIAGWVARNRKIASIPDPRADSRWDSSVDRRTGFQTRNILAAPLISSHDDRLVGVLQLLNRREGHFDQFDEQLLQAFASHAATAIERSRLVNEARRAETLQVAIDLGHRIQKSFLPGRLPELPGYELAAWWEPAEAVSGDYYDVVHLPDGRTGLAMADVSGHGVGPALLMASARSMLQAACRSHSDPAAILALISQLICADLQEGRFMTFLVAALDARQHRLAWANAGHAPAIHLRRGAGDFAELRSTGLPVGFEETLSPPEAPPVSVDPGDLILLATDGLIELRNDQGEMFGLQRLKQLLLDHQTLPAPALLNRLRAAVADFRPRRELDDDITVLLVERKLNPA